MQHQQHETEAFWAAICLVRQDPNKLLTESPSDPESTCFATTELQIPIEASRLQERSVLLLEKPCRRSGVAVQVSPTRLRQRSSRLRTACSAETQGSPGSEAHPKDGVTGDPGYPTRPRRASTRAPALMRTPTLSRAKTCEASTRRRKVGLGAAGSRAAVVMVLPSRWPASDCRLELRA